MNVSWSQVLVGEVGRGVVDGVGGTLELFKTQEWGEFNRGKPVHLLTVFQVHFLCSTWYHVFFLGFPGWPANPVWMGSLR